jgi:hypothetical protein
MTMMEFKLGAALLVSALLGSTAFAQECSDKNWKACKGKP